MEITGKIKLVDNSAENIVIFLLEEDTETHDTYLMISDKERNNDMVLVAFVERQLVKVEYKELWFEILHSFIITEKIKDAETGLEVVNITLIKHPQGLV